MISQRKLETVLNHLLEPHAIKDYCPNGLQVEGRERIRKVVTGVTASQASSMPPRLPRPMPFWFTTATSGAVSRPRSPV